MERYTINFFLANKKICKRQKQLYDRRKAESYNTFQKFKSGYWFVDMLKTIKNFIGITHLLIFKLICLVYDLDFLLMTYSTFMTFMSEMFIHDLSDIYALLLEL